MQHVYLLRHGVSPAVSVFRRGSAAAAAASRNANDDIIAVRAARQPTFSGPYSPRSHSGRDEETSQCRARAVQAGGRFARGLGRAQARS